MALLNEYAEIDEIVPGQFRHTQHVKNIGYRENGSLLSIVQDWENSGDSLRPHQVIRAPIMVTVGEDGMRRMHPTRELDRYLELGAPFIKTAGVWGKVNLGTPTRTGSRLQWTRPQANMYVDFGGHFVKLAILLKGGFVPEDSQIAFPVGMTGFTRSGSSLLRDGVVIAQLQKPVMVDFANSRDIRPIDGQFVNIAGQPYWHMTLPDLTGMVQPVIDPTLTLQPDATAGIDAYVASDTPTTNFATNQNIFAGEYNAGVQVTRSFIKFDLSALPSDAIISSAILTLFKSSTDYSSNNRTLRVYRVKRAWVEAQVTWNIWSTSNNWSTAGGFHTDDTEQTDIGSRAMLANEPTLVTNDIVLTPTTKSALDLGNGWMLKMDTETDDMYEWPSSDTATSSWRPKLVIIYTLPSDKQSVGRGIGRGVLRGAR